MDFCVVAICRGYEPRTPLSEVNDSLFGFYSGLKTRQRQLNLVSFKYSNEYIITAGAYVVSPAANPVIYELGSLTSYPAPGYTTATGTTSRRARRPRPR